MKRRQTTTPDPTPLTLAPDEVGRTSVRPAARAKARPTFTAEQLVRIARTRWKPIVGTIAAVVVVAAIIAATLPKRYRATAVGVVAPLTNTLTPSEAFHGVEALDRRSVVATVAALPSTAWTQHRDYDISAAVLPNTNLVRIDVDASSALRRRRCSSTTASHR